MGEKSFPTKCEKVSTTSVDCDVFEMENLALDIKVLYDDALLEYKNSTEKVIQHREVEGLGIGLVS